MRKLGISVYPDHTKEEEVISYINKAGKNGFDRLFTCMLSVEDKVEALSKYKRIIACAKENNIEVIMDVNPKVFKDLGVDTKDLKLFYELGVSGLRIDEGFSGKEESDMTFNPYGLLIELNMSWGTKILENILCYRPNLPSLIGCHNFYPHEGTGLSWKFFLECTKQFKDKGLRTAAFISSQVGTLGPWPVEEGICTVENHRFLPVDVQCKELYQTGIIDDVIIGNYPASDEELEILGRLDRNILELNIKLDSNIDEVFEEIVNYNNHFRRGDISDRVIRSTHSREIAADKKVPLYNETFIKRGDVLVDSYLYGRYAGELHIALVDRKNNGKISVIGQVDEKDLNLLDTILPWERFKLKIIK